MILLVGIDIRTDIRYNDCVGGVWDVVANTIGCTWDFDVSVV